MGVERSSSQELRGVAAIRDEWKQNKHQSGEVSLGSVVIAKENSVCGIETIISSTRAGEAERIKSSRLPSPT